MISKVPQRTLLCCFLRRFPQQKLHPPDWQGKLLPRVSVALDRLLTSQFVAGFAKTDWWHRLKEYIGESKGELELGAELEIFTVV